MTPILNVQDIVKTYASGNKELTVLQHVTFQIFPGETAAIVGSSGSGKTTLLGLCAGLDEATSGAIEIVGKKMVGLSEDERALLRNQHIGFVFQNFQLIPTLTALENVMIPIELQQQKNAKNKAVELLERVGLKDRLTHYPSQLSGGEQQRVSIARAFSNNPKILFADEPTGNLDDETGAQVEDLIFQLNRELGTTLLIVTHDNELAQKTNRIIRLKGGQIISDQNVVHS